MSATPLVPRQPLIVGVGCGAFYGLVTRLVADSRRFEPLFAVMTISFLFLVPVVIGYLTVRPHPRPSWTYRLLAPWVSTVLGVLAAWAVGWEGAICVIMATPLLLILSSLGGMLGAVRALKHRSATMAALLLPFVAAPIEKLIPSSRSEHRVETAIVIDAPARQVWNEIVEVPEIRPEERHPALFTRLGFPYPMSAVLSGSGVGAIRHARFERGVLFVETVTRWEEERALAFTIAAQVDSIPPDALDRHVTIGGPYFDVLSGEYTIEQLAGGGVVLHLASSLRVSTHFNVYAVGWADAIMRSIQENILRVIKARAEQPVAETSPA